jgi:hypothetical protein
MSVLQPGRVLDRTRLTRIAIWASLPTLLVEPFAASAYFRTPDGVDSGRPGHVQAWSGPLQNHHPGLFPWASPETVYLTYGKVFIVSMLGVLAGFVALRRPEAPGGLLDRWAPRLAPAGYVLLTLGVAGEYWTPWVDQAFYAVSLPALLLTFLSSPLLGLWLLRRRLGSRLAAWMLLLTVPGMVGLAVLGGHLGFSLLWLGAAWMLEGRELRAGVPVTRSGAGPASDVLALAGGANAR